MKIERGRLAALRVTLSAYELAALMAAARWVVEGAEGELAPEAVEQLRRVLDSYDAATGTRQSAPAPVSQSQTRTSER